MGTGCLAATGRRKRRGSGMKNGLMFTIKAIALWLALMVGQILSGMVILAMVHGPLPGSLANEPLTAIQAMAIVAAAFAVVLGLLAATMRWSTWGKAAALFVILYGLETLLSFIESIYFNTYLHLPVMLLAGMAVGNIIKAGLVAVACALLWPAKSGVPAEPLGGLVWKLPVIIPLYILVYFAAGQFIAWQGAELRDYYGQGLQIDRLQLSLLQVFRGAIWAGLALLLVKSLKGGIWQRAVMTGLAFAVLMALVLLMPNPYMPWAVRRMHLLEVFSSNFLFGIACVLILMAGKPGPDSKASLPGAAHP